MEISLKKQNIWVDFEYNSLHSDKLSGKNFRANYIVSGQVLQVKIDFSHNLRGRLETNNKLDAKTFVSGMHTELKAVIMNNGYIRKTLGNFLMGKTIQSKELILSFDKEYKYGVKMSGEGETVVRFVIDDN
jgi:hypothetical protein